MQAPGALAPRPPERHADEVVHVREHDVREVRVARREREQRDGRGDAGGAEERAPAREQQRAHRRDEPRAHAAAQAAPRERHADREPERPPPVQAGAHDEVAHVRDDVRDAEEDRAEQEEPERRDRGGGEREEDEQRAEDGDPRFAARDERARGARDERVERAACAVERSERRLRANQDPRAHREKATTALGLGLPGVRSRVHDAPLCARRRRRSRAHGRSRRGLPVHEPGGARGGGIPLPCAARRGPRT